MKQTLEELAIKTEADYPAYKGHPIFDALNSAVDFYDNLDFSVMGFPKLGVRSIINIDSLIYSSTIGTLESIRMILQKGYIGDAFCLLRKYYDICTLNLYLNVYLEEHASEKPDVVEEIMNWKQGKKKLPHNTFRTMRDYLGGAPKAKTIIDLVFQDKNYSDTRDRCNDHTHLNYFDNILINDISLHFLNRTESLDLFYQDFMNIMVFHTACLFYTNEHYMMASDYMDHLEVGETPPEDSQYWVADFIQKTFNNLIVARRPDLGEAIKRNTLMQIV